MTVLPSSNDSISQKAQLFDLSYDMLCIISQDNTFRFVNPAFETILGYAQDDFPSRSITAFLHPADHIEALKAFEQVRRGVPGSFAGRFRCHNGTEKWLMWTLYPRPEGFACGVARDLTPFREIEEMENKRMVFAEALLDTVLAINSSLALEEVLERILTNIEKVVSYHYVSIILVESGVGSIVGYRTTGQFRMDDAGIRALQLPIEEYRYLVQIATTGTAIIVPDIVRDPVWENPPGMKLYGAYLGVPVAIQDTVIGFLVAINAKPNFFTPLHARQLTAFANQAGVAINNARLYAQAQTAAILKERQRMAQELHDSVNQSLAAAGALAQLLPKALEKKPEKVPKYVMDIGQLIQGALAKMRMILLELRPDSLIQADLGELIRQLCSAHTGSTGTLVTVSIAGNIMLASEMQIAFYRIAQESLYNIEKHAQATEVFVTLRKSNDTVELTIEDNGRGFNQDKIPVGHFGLRNMRERAESIGAELQIHSQANQGTTITLKGNLSG